MSARGRTRGKGRGDREPGISFLAFHEVQDVHDRIIAEFGGEPGVLNAGLLEAALHRADHGPFERGDMAERVAFVLRGIGSDHPFVDGNKRTAFAVAQAFLGKNGSEIRARDDAVIDVMLASPRADSTWTRSRRGSGADCGGFKPCHT